MPYLLELRKKKYQLLIIKLIIALSINSYYRSYDRGCSDIAGLANKIN